MLTLDFIGCKHFIYSQAKFHSQSGCKHIWPSKLMIICS